MPEKTALSLFNSRRGFLRMLAGSVGALAAIPPATGRQSSAKEGSFLYESGEGNISLALTGDSMISRPLIPFHEEGFLKLRNIISAADVRFTNGEILFHNYENSPTYYTRTYMRADPRLIKDLQWLGINLMSCANNHGIDFGEGGVLTNIRNLDEAGMVHAGSGSNYAEAVAPGYLETAKGRVALVSATSSGRANSRAGEQRRDMKGRPGVNLIRWINEWNVDKGAFGAFDRAAQAFGWEPGDESPTRVGTSASPGKVFLQDYGIDQKDSTRTVYFADRNDLAVGSEDPAARFVMADSFERHTRISQSDFHRNLQSVSNARRMADWVVYSVHNHEGRKTIEEPSEHIEVLAHAVVVRVLTCLWDMAPTFFGASRFTKIVQFFTASVASFRRTIPSYWNLRTIWFAKDWGPRVRLLISTMPGPDRTRPDSARGRAQYQSYPSRIGSFRTSRFIP